MIDLSADWMTARQAAELLGVSDRTLFTLTKEGRVPSWRVELRRVKPHAEDSDDDLSSRQVESGHAKEAKP